MARGVNKAILYFATLALLGCTERQYQQQQHAGTEKTTFKTSRYGVTRFIDKKYRVVCYINNSDGGISCLKIQEKQE